ncbi:MAG: type II toxin-antitoxin system VapC family toxin [Deinococcota bacterium]|jgi:PIN domain nuclease of toxin-antitoxin system|nr:type II toxin-antitoxin system VapC family toxin [Deinococcota bacterium]
MDASAVLALLQREAGAETVELRGAVMNSVNFAEVVQKSVARQRPVDTLLHELALLGLSVTPFTPQEAQLTGELYEKTRTHGLSLADRCCLATAQLLGAVAVTADRQWLEVPHGVEVRSIR